MEKQDRQIEIGYGYYNRIGIKCPELSRIGL
jgi:hypothetical protein